MKDEELREEIVRILEMSETMDIDPPWSILPKGHPDWGKLKAQCILSLVRQHFEQEKAEAVRKERNRIKVWLNGWCEHTTNPLQRRYLCKACRQALTSDEE